VIVETTKVEKPVKETASKFDKEGIKKESNVQSIKTVEPKKAKSPSPEENLEVDWECEHCTFVNSPPSKICMICCKTRTAILKKMPVAEEPIEIPSLNSTEDETKKKGRIKKISFLAGTKAH
jgi:hypothetical protein